MAATKLQRVIASAGELSRRAAQSAVLNGKVSVNGKKCYNPAMPLQPNDTITLNGRSLDASAPIAEKMWRYHKPPGLMCTHADTHGRPTVFEALPPSMPKSTISVGRLDLASEGLLLLTTNGSLARWLEHPSSNIVREYLALLSTGERSVTPPMLASLERGIQLRDGFQFAPMDVELLQRGIGDVESGAGRQWVRMRLTEGKKHEVRRSWAEFGFATMRLVRTAYGPFRLDELRPGEVEDVGEQALDTLQRARREAFENK